MKISIILLDWSIRESFHSIDYLNDQNAVRSDYELIWVEYFDRKVSVLDEYYQTGYLDKYLVLGNKPGDYNKHIAWNTGVSSASGDTIVLCDSDVIFRRSFIQNIIDFFESHNNSFLLIDEIRSENKCFWPFANPAWEEVLAAPGVVNWNAKAGVTNGLMPQYENLPLWEKMFYRNYGACLCVRKLDFIKFGGLDEHESYVGYICGPYDLAVRMVNGGIQELWHTEEFLLHTYHPWIKPALDRIGPHFRNNSTTTFKHLFDGDTMPYQENEEIRSLRKQIFTEPSREGLVKFSVIVLKPNLRFIQRLYDSVKKATQLPFEVIFIGEEDFKANEESIVYLKYSGSLYKALIEGCSKAQGEIIAIIPGEAIFRNNALDKLIDHNMKLHYNVVYLNAIETYTQGFIWQYSTNRFNCATNVFMMTAFDTNLISDNITEFELRKILCDGRKIGSIFETPVHIEIWHDDIPVYDEYLESLLIEMLEMQYSIEYNDENNFAKINFLFNEIFTVEEKLPGSCLKYCFLKRYGLIEYCNFINNFRKFNRIDLIIQGLELLTRSTSVLLTDINENIKEVFWSNRQIYSQTAHLIGSAFFNIAIYELNNGNKNKAVENLESCLTLIPSHKEAINILASLRGINSLHSDVIL